MKSRKKLFNAIMAAAIALILLAGTMIAGNLLGWFDRKEGTVTFEDGTRKSLELSVLEKTGGANIERGGIAYSLKQGLKLRDGDLVETLNGSAVTLSLGKNAVYLDENSEAVLRIAEGGEVTLELTRGGAFALANEPFALRLFDAAVRMERGALAASAPSGSADVYVFRGQLTIDGRSVRAGQAANLLQEGITVKTLSLQALNDFQVQGVYRANQSGETCFTDAQLDELVAARQAELLATPEPQAVEPGEAATPTPASTASPGKTTPKPTGAQTGGPEPTAQATGGKQTPAEQATPRPTATKPAAATPTPVATRQLACTIEIRCDTILNNMDDLEEGKDKYVPANGCLLARSKIAFEEGETVFDVLKRACAQAGIQLEYSWTPMYDSYYVEGINHLYEFDCGNQSGWMYKVNGWFPNYGCSSYTLKDGDAIVWCYTCKGLGADVGGSVQ